MVSQIKLTQKYFSTFKDADTRVKDQQKYFTKRTSMPKQKKPAQEAEAPSEEPILGDNEEIKAIVMLPYRVRRADTNNVVIEKLKKRATTDDTYWDVEGYYNNHVSAIIKLFYKDISKDNMDSIKELNANIKSTEKRLLKAIQDFKL